MKPKRILKWALGIGLLAISSTGVLAASTNVYIIDYAFSPADISINVNDTVQWIWQGNYHSTTSDDGLWDSGVYNVPHSYSYTFSNGGTFTYTCSIHYFAGSVAVQSANVPPTVLLTNPPNGATLSAPANLTLMATASASGGSITNVAFFQNAVRLGNVANNPYSFPVSNLAASDYTFSAVATDSNGLSATNSAIIHVVNAVALNLGAPQKTSDSAFQFSYAATPGLIYVVQRSPDLLNWAGMHTNVAVSNPVVFQDLNATNSAAFYRVLRLANP